MLDYPADAQKNILIPQFMIFMKLMDGKPDELIAFILTVLHIQNIRVKIFLKKITRCQKSLMTERIL